MPSAHDGTLFYQLEGASRDELGRGLAAARAMFAEAGADPWDCARAAFDIEGGGRVTPRMRRLGGLWFGALATANKAATGKAVHDGKMNDFGMWEPWERGMKEDPNTALLPLFAI